MATVVVSVSAGAGGGDLATGEHFLESENVGTETVLLQKKMTVSTLVLLT